MDEPGYQPVGTPHGRWLRRHPETWWQVAGIALLAAVVFGATGYLVGRNAVSAIVGATVFGLFYGLVGVFRLRRARH